LLLSEVIFYYPLGTAVVVVVVADLL